MLLLGNKQSKIAAAVEIQRVWRGHRTRSGEFFVVVFVFYLLLFCVCVCFAFDTNSFFLEPKFMVFLAGDTIKLARKQQ